MKLRSIMLIDDDEPTNYVHQIIIKRTIPKSEVICAHDGREGLDMVKSNCPDSEDGNNLIFLDLNMPRMNGWEFLEEFENLSEEEKRKNKIYILSTSSLPFEKLKAKEQSLVNGMLTKPLTPNMLNQIVEREFAA